MACWKILHGKFDEKSHLFLKNPASWLASMAPLEIQHAAESDRKCFPRSAKEEAAQSSCQHWGIVSIITIYIYIYILYIIMLSINIYIYHCQSCQSISISIYNNYIYIYIYGGFHDFWGYPLKCFVYNGKSFRFLRILQAGHVEGGAWSLSATKDSVTA